MALDEHREAFSPTLWHLPKKDNQSQLSSEESISEKKKNVDDAFAAYYAKAYNKKVPLPERQKLKAAYNQARRELVRAEEYSKDASELLQVWFPGVHINIGGGSSDSLEDKGDLEGKLSCSACSKTLG